MQFDRYKDLVLAVPFYAVILDLPVLNKRYCRTSIIRDWRLSKLLSTVGNQFYSDECGNFFKTLLSLCMSPINMIYRIGSWFANRKYSSLYDFNLVKKMRHLNNDELDQIEKDEELITAYVYHHCEALYQALSRKYFLPVKIVEFLMEEDLRIFTWLISSDEPSARIETFSERALKRLEVHKKNRNVLHSLISDQKVNRKAYFDVGCLFGLSMIAAAELGFDQVHGCEVDEKVYKRARKIAAITQSSLDIDYCFHEGNLLDIHLHKNQYTLVTVNNVLEHTPDLEQTIKVIADIMAKDGLCYIYQGNFRSPNFVRFEPHYHLPILTILPKEQTIEILMRLKRIKKPSDYVVNRWPSMEELMELFNKFGLNAIFSEKSLGYWGISEVPSEHTVKMIKRALKMEAKEKIIPVLNSREREEMQVSLQNYLDQVDKAVLSGDPNMAISWLKPTWDILVYKK